jgi:hypothetical protein
MLSTSLFFEEAVSDPSDSTIGLTLRTMTLLAPSARMRSRASYLEPSPTASMAMTEPTPR